MEETMKILAVLSVAATLAALPAAADFYGGWDVSRYDEYGRELLLLGDNTDGMYFYLSGTNRYCKRPGESYARMREIVSAVHWEVEWWIDAECSDNVIRVCVENAENDWGCSSYLRRGWDYP